MLLYFFVFECHLRAQRHIWGAIQYYISQSVVPHANSLLFNNGTRVTPSVHVLFDIDSQLSDYVLFMLQFEFDLVLHSYYHLYGGVVVLLLQNNHITSPVSHTTRHMVHMFRVHGSSLTQHGSSRHSIYRIHIGYHLNPICCSQSNEWGDNAKILQTMLASFVSLDEMSASRFITMPLSPTFIIIINNYL